MRTRFFFAVYFPSSFWCWRDRWLLYMDAHQAKAFLFSFYFLAVTCPQCSYGQAYFMQIQIRSADEPMTTFYKCCNPDCAFNWKEGWFSSIQKPQAFPCVQRFHSAWYVSSKHLKSYFYAEAWRFHLYIAIWMAFMIVQFYPYDDAMTGSAKHIHSGIWMC